MVGWRVMLDWRVMVGWRVRPVAQRAGLSGQVRWKPSFSSVAACSYRRGGSGDGAWGAAGSVLSGQRRMLSSSTLVSEEWALLWTDEASLSRESTDDVVEVDVFLRCLDVELSGVVLAAAAAAVVERWLSGEIIESCMMNRVLPDGGDTSRAFRISAEADLTCWLPGCPGVVIVAGRE
jgi:hypothetical protein